MILSKILTAEVIDTKFAYQESVDELDRPLPQGTIKVRWSIKGTRSLSDYAYPLSPYETEIPKIGEMVTLFKSISPNTTTPATEPTKYYYLRTVNLHNNIFENKLPGLYNVESTGKPDVQNQTIQKDNEIEEDTFEIMPKAQPYEGDKHIQSRFGSLIRFTSNNTEENELIKYDRKNKLWEGPNDFSPLIMITNGLNKDDSALEKYILEDPAKDKSLIYLTSNQKIKFDTSQRRIGINNITPIQNYNESQIIFSADRLLLNSKTDYIILSGKKSVNIATPKWRMDMNDFFTLFESFLNELQKTASGQSPYLTGWGPTYSNPSLLAGISAIKTKLSSMKQ